MSFEFEFNQEKLKKCLPKMKQPEVWYPLMEEIMPQFEITTVSRAAMFMAQCGHESAYFNVLEENLNYSAQGLNTIFPKYFIKAGRDAQEYHRQPSKIANVVYSSRMGNGDTASGDGWKYRGRGLIQLTGRSNYTQCSQDLFQDNTLVDTPDLVTEPTYALWSGCWFWHKNNLNDLADAGDIKASTKRINGGFIGLEDRERHYNNIMQILGS
jgi:putative chitinase